MSIGVYIVLNKIVGKYYVGQTRRGAKARLRQHFTDARRGSQTYFHRAIRKYKEKNFVLYDWFECDAQQLNALEVLHISRLKTNNRRFGYNSTSGGETITEFTKEVLAKIGAKSKKRWEHMSSHDKLKISKRAREQCLVKSYLVEFNKKLTPEEHSAQSRKGPAKFTFKERQTFGRKGGFIGGKRTVESGHLARISSYANHVRWHVGPGIHNPKKCEHCANNNASYPTTLGD